MRVSDNQSQQSVADQAFQYDLTLSHMTVPRTVRARMGLVARFQLSRAATVTLQVETSGGVVVRTLSSLELQAGAGRARWDGTLADGSTTASAGSYVAHVTAVSAVGTMDVTAPFTLRR